MAQIDDDSYPDYRIVLVGRPGVGKSATGNTILGNRLFQSKTQEVAGAAGETDGRRVVVIDTPDFFDLASANQAAVMDYLSKTPREPRVFLLVMKAGKFSDGEKMMRQMQEDFGPRINESTIVLFTHGDLLEYRIMEEYIDKIPGLKELIEECGGRYQVFNNTDISDRKQVRNLFELIEKIAFVRAELKARQLKRMEELVQQQQRELEELLQAQQQNLNVLIKKHKNQIEELLKREGKLQEEAPKSKSWIPFLK